MNNNYTAYGLKIQSDIRLSAAPSPASHADVQVRRGKVEFPAEAADRTMWTTESDIRFRLNGAGKIEISRGCEIVVDADVEDKVAAQYVMGLAIGAVLHQRGLLVLHGSAVLVNGGVVAFLGHSGWGKSTMAAAMVKLGCAGFSDDLVPVSMADGVPSVLPGYPFLKIARESGEVLGYEDPEWAPLLPEDTRSMIAVEGPDPQAPKPLSRIFVLKEGDQPEIAPMKPQAAVIELIRYSYGSPWVRKSGMSKRHLECCAALVESVPVCTLSRPRRLDLIQAVAELVLEECGEGVGELT